MRLSGHWKGMIIVGVVMAGALIALGLWDLVPPLRNSHALYLVAKYRAHPDQSTAEKLADMLSFGNLPRETGSEVLSALVEPSIDVPRPGVVGEPVGVTIRPRCGVALEIRNYASVSQTILYPGAASVGASSQPGRVGGGPQTILAQQPGQPEGIHSGEVLLEFKLIRLHGKAELSGVRRPGRSGLAGILPSAVVIHGNYSSSEKPAYEARFRIPFEYRLVGPVAESRMGS